MKIKSTSLNSKLKSYSVFAGSILAASSAANAQVIYTDLVPDKEMGGVVIDSTYFAAIPLDLNNDGTFDFRIFLNNYGIDTVAPGYSFAEGIDGDYDVLNNVIITYTIEYAPWGIKLDCNQQVPFSYYVYGNHFANLGYQFGAVVANNWKNVHDKYLGVKFKAADGLHYGWIRLDVNTAADNIPNIIVKSYAFQDSIGIKIQVCDTGTSIGNTDLHIVHNDLNVFPNPSTGKCIINLGKSVSGEMELRVEDALGRLVINGKINLSGKQTELPFDFSEFSPGLYFIRLSNSSETFSGKWVKN